MKDVTTAPALAPPWNNNSMYLMNFCNTKHVTLNCQLKCNHVLNVSVLTLGLSNRPGSTAAAERFRPSKKLICVMRMANEAAQV